MAWVTAIVGLAGAGASIYGASQNKNRGGGYGSIDTLSVRDYMDIIDAMGKKQKELMDDQIKMTLQAYPAFAKAERAATTEQRKQDLTDLRSTGPGVAQTLSLISPAYMALGSAAAQAAMPSPLLAMLNARAMTSGQTGLRRMLQDQAVAELELGDRLNPEQERAAAQQARAGAAGRGMESGLATLSAEILNRDANARALLNSRRGFAANMQALGQGEDQMLQTFAANVENLNQANAGNSRNFLINASQAQVDPIMRATVLNRTNVSPALPAQVMATAPTVAMLSQAAAPMMNFNMQALDTTLNANAAAKIAAANNSAGMASGAMSMLGSAMQGAMAGYGGGGGYSYR